MKCGSFHLHKSVQQRFSRLFDQLACSNGVFADCGAQMVPRPVKK